MHLNSDKFSVSLVVRNEAGEVDYAPAVKAMGAIKTFGLFYVDQRFPNVKGTEPLREPKGRH